MTLKLKTTALATLALLSSLAVNAHADEARKTYIVQLKDEPAVTYRGGVTGLAATQPQSGENFRYGSDAVQAYVGYLSQQQASIAATLGNAPVLANYHTVFNGFAAVLTEDQAKALKANAGVIEIFEDQARKLDTVSTSKFLGLSTPGGLWSQSANGSPLTGENMVVGVVDGGIWPESPAFADHVDGNGAPTFNGGSLAYGPAPASFHGGCKTGEGFDPAKHCNNKLIGAKFYNAGFLASGYVQHWTDFASARDSIGGATGHGGHGDHTASTAAGNGPVGAVVSGITMGSASGMAPRARVAAYKVCWTFEYPDAYDGTGSANSCFVSDSVAAIDDAVKDGVDVINFSISGAQNTVNDPVEQAFYRAALAGVFVAAAGGNSGPANMVAHISPWLTTVAASTHDRSMQGDLLLGNGTKYTGASLSVNGLPNTPVIRAEDAGIAGADADLNLCFSNPLQLDPVKVAGKIVICTRGTNARVDKSLAVLNAGGVGMIMADNGGGLVAEAHSVPTVHVSQADGEAIKAYASSLPSASSSMTSFYIGTKPAPIMAAFSSRGPNMGDSNILKPDLTAPGVDVIASVTPALNPAERDAVASGAMTPPPAWESYQGTSMAAPHVAGIGLLLKQAHPTWSPAAIKSALMTTAYPTLDDGLPGAQNGKLPWAQGAGHIDPNKAVDPGLVYDAGKVDYVRYQCLVNRASVPPADCTTYGTLDATYNLNLPSITVGSVAGAVTVIRSVTNVGSTAATYNATASVPGIAVTVTPSTLTLSPGETKSFTVKLTPNGANEGVWQFGALSWTDGTHTVRSPIQARAGTSISAPAMITGNTASGTRLFTVRTTFDGRMRSTKGGLKDVTMGAANSLVASAMEADALKAVCQAGVDTPNVKVYNFNVPFGTIVARFALRQEDVGNAADDHDLMLVTPDNKTAYYSGNSTSNEAVQVSSPASGNYKVCVLAYGNAMNGGAAMTHKLSSWIVRPSDTGGAFNVMLPSQVYNGGSASVGMTWSGLPAGHRYVGGVQFIDLANLVQATTVLRVETNGGLPVTDAPESLSSKVAPMKR
ncbi:S8 family peptidase [Burkholderiaceae bacterium UC74_6]